MQQGRAEKRLYRAFRRMRVNNCVSFGGRRLAAFPPYNAGSGRFDDEVDDHMFRILFEIVGLNALAVTRLHLLQ